MIEEPVFSDSVKKFGFPVRVFVFSLQSFFSLTLLEGKLRGGRGFDVPGLKKKEETLKKLARIESNATYCF